MNGPVALNEKSLLEAFARLNEKLSAQNVTGELCLFGGAVMVLSFNARLSTQDVDATFFPTALIRQACAEIAEDLQWNPSWLNDGVKGFLSPQGETTLESLPQFSHLQISRPTAKYLLAMKCLAARTPGNESRGDKDDMTFLIRHLHLRTVESVLEILHLFYPPERIFPKTQFMLLEIMAELKEPE